MDSYEIANLNTRFMNAGMMQGGGMMAGGAGGVGVMGGVGAGGMPGGYPHINDFMMGLPSERQSILSTLESRHMLNPPAGQENNSLPNHQITLSTVLSQ